MDSQNSTGRSMRGFASMDKEKQKEIASKGGRAAHEKGTAHEFDSQEASQAAKKATKGAPRTSSPPTKPA